MAVLTPRGRSGLRTNSLRELRESHRSLQTFNSGRLMQITLNGQLTELAEPYTLDGLLQHLRLTGRRVAIELNGAIVPRSQATETRVQSGDRVEIVHAIGGG